MSDFNWEGAMNRIAWLDSPTYKEPEYECSICENMFSEGLKSPDMLFECCEECRKRNLHISHIRDVCSSIKEANFVIDRLMVV